MSFSIRILDQSGLPPTGEVFGEIQIGEFVEIFLITPISGSLKDVVSAWEKELKSLISGASVIALRTDPKFAWLVYRQGDVCIFQEQLLLPHLGYTSESGLIVKLPEYRNITEAGNKISEWYASLSDISSFLNLTNHSSGTR